jgi:arsenate reductase-like glutaredoxin family protein
VKEFLSQKNIAFTERNVKKDKDALNELRKTGAMVTPLTVINGKYEAGFNKSRLKQLLKDRFYAKMNNTMQ